MESAGCNNSGTVHPGHRPGGAKHEGGAADESHHPQNYESPQNSTR